MSSKFEISQKRHSAAHVLAAAVLAMFPEAKLGTGPDTKDGFYYDFILPRSIIPEDLEILEGKMKDIVKKQIKFEKYEKSADTSVEFLKSVNQDLKVELAEEFRKQGIVNLSFYKNGDFVDLCEGPHVDHTGQIGVFKLTKFSSAYWRGDSEREATTRIYGVCFETEKEMRKYEKMIEEAKKRDHRKIGKDLDLFTFSDSIGAGLPLFTPKGTLLRDLIIKKIDFLQKEYGWQKVCIPHIAKSDLYEKSGHWDKYKDDLFHVKGKSNSKFVMKPMNCPHHTQIFNSSPKSYKDLPVRYAESTAVYRDEQAGELMGLSRVRSITQDDGHAFCTEEQVEEEVKNIVSIIEKFYSQLGMFEKNKYWVSLSVMDPKTPDKYMNEDGIFQKAEEILEKIAKDKNLPYKRVEGEAAFYGPKLDFQFFDALGREWQLGTVQLDFSMPRRFNLNYTDHNGEKKHPVMIHRAIAGSLERFLSVIIEHFAGIFPLWLAPVQFSILPVAEVHFEDSKKLKENLENKNLRVELFDKDDSLGKKIRESEMKKIPYIIIIGDEEVKNETLTIRKHGEKKQVNMKLDEIVDFVNNEGIL